MNATNLFNVLRESLQLFGSTENRTLNDISSHLQLSLQQFAAEKANEFVGRLRTWLDGIVIRFINTEHLLQAKLTKIRVGEKNYEKPDDPCFTFVAEIEKTKLLLRWGLSRFQSFEFEISTIGFEFCNKQLKQIELRNLAAKGTLTISQASSTGTRIQTVPARLVGHILVLSKPITVTDCIKAGSPFMHLFLKDDTELNIVDARKHFKILEKATSDYEFHYTIERLAFYGSWVPSTSTTVKFNPDSSPMIEALGNNITRLQLKIQEMQYPSKPTLICSISSCDGTLLQSENISIQFGSGKAASSKILITTPNHNIANENQPFKSLLTLQYLHPMRQVMSAINSTFITAIGRLNLGRTNDDEDIAKKLQLPDMILDTCVGAYSTTTSYEGPSSKVGRELKCSFLYHPSLANAEYEFFTMRGFIERKDKTLNFRVFLELVQPMRQWVTPCWSSHMDLLVLSTGTLYFAVTLEKFMKDWEEYLTPLSALPSGLDKISIHGMKLQFNVHKRTMKFCFAGSHVLTLDLVSGYAELEIAGASQITRFKIKRSRRQAMFQTRLVEEMTLRDVVVHTNCKHHVVNSNYLA